MTSLAAVWQFNRWPSDPHFFRDSAQTEVCCIAQTNTNPSTIMPPTINEANTLSVYSCLRKSRLTVQ